MPLLNPSHEEQILSEMREREVLSPELISQIMTNQDEFRLIDKLVEYKTQVRDDKWIAYLCKDPLFSYIGCDKPSPSFLTSLDLNSRKKETLLNYGVIPFKLENDILWMCGINTSPEVDEIGKELFDNISFKAIRYCALPLTLIGETLSILNRL